MSQWHLRLADNISTYIYGVLLAFFVSKSSPLKIEWYSYCNNTRNMLFMDRYIFTCTNYSFHWVKTPAPTPTPCHCGKFLSKYSCSLLWVRREAPIRNKKDRWDSGKPCRQQILFCDIQIKVVISRRQIYVYHKHLPLKIWVTLTLTFQGHSRSNLKMPLDSPYMVSY